jgi:hypothetical protein
MVAGLDAARRPIDDQLGHPFFQLFGGCGSAAMRRAATSPVNMADNWAVPKP